MEHTGNEDDADMHGHVVVFEVMRRGAQMILTVLEFIIFILIKSP